MTPSEKIASRYAEIFVSVFDRIVGDSTSPFLSVGKEPHAGVNGVPFRGCNALLTSMVAADRGFGIPVWLTRSMISELGLLINKGERNTPIVHYDVFYEDRETGKKDPSMNDALYNALSDEERKGWVKRCYMTAFPEFNIAQTNFAEVYPEQWAELTQEFGSPVKESASCDILDRYIDGSLLEEGLVPVCPVSVSFDVKRPTYFDSCDVIRVPDKSVYSDESRFYSDLLHELSHATGSEMRLERNLYSDKLSDRAQEELVAELSGATVSTMLGLQSCLQEHNLSFLKSWSSAISEEPVIIYRAVNDAAKSAEMISHSLGLEQRPGFNLEKMMDGVEAAQKARSEAQERREKAQQRVGVRHHKGYRPVKTQKSKGHKI